VLLCRKPCPSAGPWWDPAHRWPGVALGWATFLLSLSGVRPFPGSVGPMGHLGPPPAGAWGLHLSPAAAVCRWGLKSLLLLEEEVALGEREGIEFNYPIIIDGIRAVSALRLRSAGWGWWMGNAAGLFAPLPGPGTCINPENTL